MANEFKIKNGVIINDTVPVTGIVSDTTLSASSDENLVTESAIKTYTTDQISSIEGLAPAGGIAGYVLKKVTNDDYDYMWAESTGGGGTSGGVPDAPADDTYLRTSGAWVQSDIFDYETLTLYATSADLENHVINYNNPHQVDQIDVGLGNVDNTSDLDKPISTATQNALDLKADSSDLTTLSADFDSHTSDATIHFTEASIDHTNIQNIGTNSHVQIDTHISSTSNPHSVDKTQVGLGNVDNTSDLDKPISTVTQSALDLKADISALGDYATSADLILHETNYMNPHQVDQTAVGLPLVDNTSDLDKPISTATQNALDLKADSSDLTTLSADFDSHTSDVTIHFTEASIDHTVIQNIGTNTHIQIDTHIASTSNPHSVDKTQVGLGNVDNTSDLDKPISTATQSALDLKADLTDLGDYATSADLNSHILDYNNPHQVNKADVGLGDVDNTSDLDKPISNDVQIALNAKADESDLTSHTGDATIHFTESSINHNAISNLAVGDLHTQYHNDTRGDARYYQQADVDSKDAERMKWLNTWENIAYEKNDVVRDGTWTMVANKQTSDRPAPQEQGDPVTIYDKATPSFTTQQFLGVVHSGVKVTFTQAGWARSVRVQVPELSETTNYRIVSVDVTNPAAPIVNVIYDPLLIENGWATVSLGDRVIPTGSVFEVYIDALDSGGSTQFTGGWSSQGNANTPNAQSWTRNNNKIERTTRVNINDVDLDSVNRRTELLGVVAGSEIQIADTVNPNNFMRFRVDEAPVAEAGYVSYYGVVVNYNGGISNNDPCTLNFDIPIPQQTEYVEQVGYWTSATQPDFATVEGLLTLDGVAQSVATNTYGIDITFQKAYVSDDWDLLSHISDGSGSGGSGGGSGVPEAPVDGNIYGRQNESWTDIGNEFVPVSGADYVVFNDLPSSAVPSSDPGTFWYNEGEDNFQYVTRNPNILPVINETIMFSAKNNEGATIPRGTCVDIHGFDPSGVGVQMHVADSLEITNDPDEGWLVAVTTEDVPDGEYGKVMTLGVILNVDTSMLIAGDPVYLGMDGGFTNLRPDYPAESVLIGTCLVVDSVNGVLAVFTKKDNYEYGFDGCIVEKHDTNIVVDGSSVFMDVSNYGNSARNLSVQLQGTVHNLDTTTPGAGKGPNGEARVELIQGTVTEPESQVVYIDLTGGNPDGDPELKVTAGYPPTPFAMVALVSIRDFASVGTDGPDMHRRLTSSKAHSGRGRISYFTERWSVESPKWWKGITPTVTITEGGASPDIVNLTTILGTVYQTHRQDFPARDISTDGVYLANGVGGSSLTNYTKYTNLYDLMGYVADSSVGRDITSRGNLVIFGSVNKEETECKLYVNLPSDLYGQQGGQADNCYYDVDDTADYTVPDELRFTAFLICRIPYYISGNEVVFSNPTGRPDIINLLGTPIGVSGGATGGGGAFVPTIAQVLTEGNDAGNQQIKNITDGTLTGDAINLGQLTNHTGDGTIHFTESSIDHTVIQNVGSNTHAQIDTHIASTSNPHSVTHAQVGTHIGDVTGDIELTISNDAVSNAKLVNMAQARIKGRAAGDGTGNPNDLTGAQVRSIIGNTTAQWNADQLQGVNVHTTPPTDGQVLTYDPTNGWQPETPSGGGGDNKRLFTFSFQKEGAISNNTQIPMNFSESVTTLGFVIPVTGTLDSISWMNTSYSSGSEETVTVNIESFNTGEQPIAGSGTLRGNYGGVYAVTGGSFSPTFYTTTPVNTSSIPAGSFVSCYVTHNGVVGMTNMSVTITIKED